MSPLLHRLNDEWESLAHQATPLPWTCSIPELAACLCLGDVLALVPDWPEQILRGLVAEAQARKDQLAARVVLQAMIPKLVLMSSRGIAAAQDSPFDDLVTSMVTQIALVPLHRTSSIAGNLSLDSLRDAQKLWRKAAAEQEVSFETNLLDAIGETLRDPADASWAEEPEGAAVLALGEERGWLTPAARALLEAYYCRGLSSGELAELYSCSAASVRSRCRDGVTRLRAHRESILAA